MNSSRKTVNLGLFFLFALLFVSPFCVELLADEPIPGEENPFLDDDDLFLVEDDFIFEAPTLIFEANPIYESRSFDDIFPSFSQGEKMNAMSRAGLRHSFEKGGSPMLIPNLASGIDLLSSVMKRKPSHIIETLVIVPYNERELDMLDAYNALGKIQNIQEHSVIVNGKDLYIFKETTRLESARNRKPIPDPDPVDILPFSETMYLRFTDPWLGDLYLRGDVSLSLYGITYNITNFVDVRYSLFRVMKTEGLSIVIYLEPVKEGILIYSMSGLYLPGFIANRVNLTPNINVRVMTLINWITEGLRRQESIRQGNRFYRLQEN